MHSNYARPGMHIATWQCGIDKPWNCATLWANPTDKISVGACITRAVLRLECSLDCLSAPTYRYIAPRMIQRIILKFCGYVGCDDATNVSNFGYEPIKFNQLNQ